MESKPDIAAVRFLNTENGAVENLGRLYSILRKDGKGVIESLVDIGYPALSRRGKYTYQFLDGTCIVTYIGPSKLGRAGHIRHFAYGSDKEAIEDRMKRLAEESDNQFLTVFSYPLFHREELPSKFGTSFKLKDGDPNAVYRLALMRSDFEEQEYHTHDKFEKDLADLQTEGFTMVSVAPDDYPELAYFANSNYPDNTFDVENVRRYNSHFAFKDPHNRWASLAGIGGKRKAEAEGHRYELYLMMDGITRADLQDHGLVSHLVRKEANVTFGNNPNAVIIVDANQKSKNLLEKIGFKHISTSLWCDYFRQ